MFNFYAVEKANELRRQELLEIAARERLAREVEAASSGKASRFEGVIKRIVPFAAKKIRSFAAGSPALEAD